MTAAARLKAKLVEYGMDHYWPFDGSTNDTRDQIGSVNPTVVGSPGRTVPGPFGGVSLDPDGSNYYLATGVPLYTGDFTIGAWYQPDSTAAYQIFWGRSGNNNNYISRGNTDVTCQSTSGSTTKVWTAPAVTVGSWELIIVRRIAGVGDVFVNGVKLAGGGTLTGSYGMDLIGRYNAGSSPCGPMAYPFMGDRGLSDAEVADLVSTMYAFRGVAEARAVSLGAALHLPLDDAFSSVTTARATVGTAGTYVGSPVKRVAGPSSFVPYGVAMDGSNDSVDTAALSLGAAQAQTFEVWLNSATPLSATDLAKSLIGSTSPVHGANYAHIRFGATSSAATNEVLTVWDLAAGTNDQTYWQGPAIPAGWHHHALTFTGTQGSWEWFLDGVNVTAQGYTKVNHLSGAKGMPSVAYRLANYYSTSYGVWAGIAGFTVYARQLRSDEVYANYRLGLDVRAPVSAGPIRY